MKNNFKTFLLLFLTFSFSAFSQKNAGSLTVEEHIEHDHLMEIIKNETTYEEWELFCDIMSYTLDSEFRAYGKNLDPKKYTTSNPKDIVQLDEEDALYYTNWLTKNGKDNTPPPCQMITKKQLVILDFSVSVKILMA